MAKLYDKLVALSAALATVLVAFIMLGVALDVAGRFLFGRPIGWMFEAIENSLLCIPLLGMAWLARRGEHVVIDVVVENLGRRPRRVLKAITELIASLTCAVIAYWAALTTWDNYERGVTTVAIYPLPKFLLIALIAFGFALTAVEFARRVIGGWRRDPEEAPAADATD